jgi:hypothetical protein
VTRLAEIPRVKLTQTDKSILVDVATRYEQAHGLFNEAYNEAVNPTPKRRYLVINKANTIRAKATDMLMRWAERRLTEAVIGPGFPRGSAHPRLKKAYDASWDHRKWGSAGCAREAAKTIRNIVKRGWV